MSLVEKFKLLSNSKDIKSLESDISNFLQKLFEQSDVELATTFNSLIVYCNPAFVYQKRYAYLVKLINHAMQNQENAKKLAAAVFSSNLSASAAIADFSFKNFTKSTNDSFFGAFKNYFASAKLKKADKDYYAGLTNRLIAKYPFKITELSFALEVISQSTKETEKLLKPSFWADLFNRASPRKQLSSAHLTTIAIKQPTLINKYFLNNNSYKNRITSEDWCRIIVANPTRLEQILPAGANKTRFFSTDMRSKFTQQDWLNLLNSFKINSPSYLFIIASLKAYNQQLAKKIFSELKHAQTLSQGHENNLSSLKGVQQQSNNVPQTSQRDLIIAGVNTAQKTHGHNPLLMEGVQERSVNDSKVLGTDISIADNSIEQDRHATNPRLTASVQEQSYNDSEVFGGDISIADNSIEQDRHATNPRLTADVQEQSYNYSEVFGEDISIADINLAEDDFLNELDISTISLVENDDADDSFATEIFNENDMEVLFSVAQSSHRYMKIQSKIFSKISEQLNNDVAIDNSKHDKSQVSGVDISNLDTVVESKSQVFGVDISNLDTVVESKSQVFGVNISSLDTAVESKSQVFGVNISSLDTAVESNSQVFGVNISSLDIAVESNSQVFGVDISSLDTAVEKKFQIFGKEINSLDSELENEPQIFVANLNLSDLTFDTKAYLNGSLFKRGHDNNSSCKEEYEQEIFQETYTSNIISPIKI